MEDDALTPEEKAKLLAHKDVGSLEDYDEEFYKLLTKPDVPNIEDLDDRIRRAIYKFVSGYYENVMTFASKAGEDEENEILAAFTIFLLQGYELGRKWHRPLTSTQSTPK